VLQVGPLYGRPREFRVHLVERSLDVAKCHILQTSNAPRERICRLREPTLNQCLKCKRFAPIGLHIHHNEINTFLVHVIMSWSVCCVAHCCSLLSGATTTRRSAFRCHDINQNCLRQFNNFEKKRIWIHIVLWWCWWHVFLPSPPRRQQLWGGVERGRTSSNSWANIEFAVSVLLSVCF